MYRRPARPTAHTAARGTPRRSRRCHSRDTVPHPGRAACRRPGRLADRAHVRADTRRNARSLVRHSPVRQHGQWAVTPSDDRPSMLQAVLRRKDSQTSVTPTGRHPATDPVTGCRLPVKDPPLIRTSQVTAHGTAACPHKTPPWQRAETKGRPRAGSGGVLWPCSGSVCVKKRSFRRAGLQERRQR